MGIKDKMAEKLGLKKKTKELPQDIIVEKRRACAQKTVERLNLAGMERDRTGKISDEKLLEYRKYINKFINRIDNASITRLDTMEMDEKLDKLAETLGAAIREGCEVSADYAVIALEYGVTHARVDILDQELEQEPEIRAKRLDKINGHLAIVNKSRMIDEFDASIQAQEKRIEEDKQEFKTVQSTMNQFIEANPLAAERLEDVGVQGAEISGETQRIVDYQERLVTLYKQMSGSTAYINQFMGEKNTALSDINTLQEQMLLTLTEADPETVRILERSQERIKSFLLDSEKHIVEGRKRIEAIHATVSQFANSPEKQKRAVKTMNEFEKMMRDQAENEIAKKAAMVRKQEEKQKQEAKNRQSEKQTITN